MLIVNNRHVSKTAFSYYDEDPDNPVGWISKYGSVTLNQYGQDVPMGGMNEKGLVISDAILSVSRYPDADERPSINESHFKQYILDNFVTVDEVFQNIGQIWIRPRDGDEHQHFFLIDHSGESLLIEIINGEYHLFTGNSLLIKGMTNSEHDKSVAHFRSGHYNENSNSSLDRFYRLALTQSRFDSLDSNIPVEDVFESLHYISENGPVIRIVYDIKNR